MIPSRGNYIGGAWRPGAGPLFRSEDPATGAANWAGPGAGPEDIQAAVAAARGAQPGWADRPLSEREAAVLSFRRALEAEAAAVAEAISRETGKPLWESRTEVAAMAAKAGHAIQAQRERLGVRHVDLHGAAGETRFKPHGVIAVFGPFNMPGHLPGSHILPALLAGNAVVYKASERAPLAGQWLAALWEAAGLPPGAFNLLQGDAGAGAALAAHPELDGLFFTGGSAGGLALHRAFAGRPEKILALEMGGNNPLLAFSAGDARAAALITVQSAFLSSGQRCVCARRLILPAGAEGDRLLDALLEVTAKLRVGPWTAVPEPFLGPVIDPAAADRVLEAQERLRASGGRVLLESRRLDGRALLSPGIMDVTEARERPDEEIFGPFLQVVRVPDFDAGLREANATAYGLAAGLLSDRRDLFERFWRGVRAGVVNWNRPLTGASGAQPFGGVGRSGNHRPSAYFAADYCAYPVASVEDPELKPPADLPPGLVA